MCLDGLVQFKVIALQVGNPGKECSTPWIATIMLLFDWTGRHASCLELGEKARQVVNAIIDQILATLSTQWPFCRHDGKHRTVALRGIRIVTVVEFHVIGIGALRKKLQAEVQRIPVGQPLRILSVHKHTGDAMFNQLPWMPRVVELDALENAARLRRRKGFVEGSRRMRVEACPARAGYTRPADRQNQRASAPLGHSPAWCVAPSPPHAESLPSVRP